MQKRFWRKTIAQLLSAVASLEKKPAKKSPAAPFTTSTLQQEAARKLYFSVSKTMNMAQRLYEAGLNYIHENRQCKPVSRSP